MTNTSTYAVFTTSPPVLTKYTSTSCLSISSPNKSAYLIGLSGKKGAPKQVENDGSGSVTPRSVPLI